MLSVISMASCLGTLAAVPQLDITSRLHTPQRPSSPTPNRAGATTILPGWRRT